MRAVLVVALAIGGAVQVVRSAIAQHNVASAPETAAVLWPTHPEVKLGLAMAQIGQAAAARKLPTRESIALSRDAARSAPLAVVPFLIEGAVAQNERRLERAQRLFTEAARRDPRSSAARFFLAQIHLSSGRPAEGLRHAAVLARLVPGSSAALVPAIATYAKSPGAVEMLRTMFARDRLLQDAVLTELARDAENHDLAIVLAGDRIGKADPADGPAWQDRLLASLVERGDFGKARSLWLRIAGLSIAPTGVFNPQFAKLPAPAPFNWSFGSGDFGFAEPGPNASLQAVYYGRAEGQLASQTLLLAPGAYQLRMRVTRESDNDQPTGLAWTITCNKATKPLMKLSVGDAKGAPRPVIGTLSVPANCPAQTIKLVGTGSEYAASEQVNISNFQLVKLPS